MAIGTPDIVLASGLDPSRVSFHEVDNPVVFRSPWDGTTQTARRFRKWRARLEWSLLTRRQHYQIVAPFNKRGLSASFLFYDPVRQDPSGDETASVLSTEEWVGATGGVGPGWVGATGPGNGPGIKVNAANQVGQSLGVKDIPNRGTSTRLLSAGDLIGFANTGQMLEVAEDFMGTNATTGTIQLTGWIGKSPAANELIYVSYVPVRMQVASPLVPDVGDGINQFSFALEMQQP